MRLHARGQVGTADFMGNPFFQGIDEAVRGLMVGEKASVEASGGEYNPELLFKVPRDHPEVRPHASAPTPYPAKARPLQGRARR